MSRLAVKGIGDGFGREQEVEAVAVPTYSQIRIADQGAGRIKVGHRGGRESDLDEAIRVLKQTVSIAPRNAPNLFGYLNNLASACNPDFSEQGAWQI